MAHARLFYAQKKYRRSGADGPARQRTQTRLRRTWNILGRAYFAAGRFEDAAALAERAMECNGDDYNTYIPYDQSLERLGRKKEAEAVFAIA